MAGAYCRFCDHRCFVPRVLPDGPRKGTSLHLATCPKGMEHDRQQGGYDHTTAINPYADPSPTAPPKPAESDLRAQIDAWSRQYEEHDHSAGCGSEDCARCCADEVRAILTKTAAGPAKEATS
jgi:hypothetical protein